MEFGEYQKRAFLTMQEPRAEGMDTVMLLLGIAGEAGELLAEYKKLLRDGDAYTQFGRRVAEELGDLLWYIAVAADKFGLDLNQIAIDNLVKCQTRWGGKIEGQLDLGIGQYFDSGFPEDQQFPRRMSVSIMNVQEDDLDRTRLLINGNVIGNDIADNAYTDDGYRYHDVFHIACAALLGWSPVLRKLLGCKRRDNSETDNVEDGGRATAIEEGLAALVFSYARDRNMLEGINTLDYNLLRVVQGMTAHLEVSQCTLGEWERTILRSFELWRYAIKNRGLEVEVDLNRKSIEFRM